MEPCSNHKGGCLYFSYSHQASLFINYSPIEGDPRQAVSRTAFSLHLETLFQGPIMQVTSFLRRSMVLTMGHPRTARCTSRTWSNTPRAFGMSGACRSCTGRISTRGDTATELGRVFLTQCRGIIYRVGSCSGDTVTLPPFSAYDLWWLWGLMTSLVSLYYV